MIAAPSIKKKVAMRVSLSVKINELRVPEVIKHGSSAVLDCDYTLEDSMDHSGLVVKWYFNDKTRPVYQWIPGAKKPQGLGILKNKLNLEYKASSDARTMHRALHILEPSAELSGEYTCVVSTFENEDTQTKKMLVFVPERSLLLRQGKSKDGSPNVACSAEGVFPQPELTVRMAQEEVESKTVLRRERDGLFDISAVASLPDALLDAPAEFACELRVPAVNYTVRRESVYYPNSGTGGLVAASPWMVAAAVAAALLVVAAATEMQKVAGTGPYGAQYIAVFEHHTS